MVFYLSFESKSVLFYEIIFYQNVVLDFCQSNYQISNQIFESNFCYLLILLGLFCRFLLKNLCLDSDQLALKGCQQVLNVLKSIHVYVNRFKIFYVREIIFFTVLRLDIRTQNELHTFCLLLSLVGFFTKLLPKDVDATTASLSSFDGRITSGPQTSKLESLSSLVKDEAKSDAEDCSEFFNPNFCSRIRSKSDGDTSNHFSSSAGFRSKVLLFSCTNSCSICNDANVCHRSNPQRESGGLTKSQPVLFSGTHFCFISIAYKHLVMVTAHITLSLGGKCYTYSYSGSRILSDLFQCL
ncbi:hypothetical protein AGLY_000487 [Aphis glycines]|uniref:Uncharacterized protein n=1 Tax=Aphis glycines TaxID=307491 RepID=A0A6G0U793_APHGL|nr:hypothetical protein AGLY_000487 [Aphis glycines]